MEHKLTFKTPITEGETHEMEKTIINMAINVFVLYSLFCCSSIQRGIYMNNLSLYLYLSVCK